MSTSQMVPVTLITGPLGSGKTTFLRQLLEEADRPMALIINEFGDVAVDAQVVESRNMRLAELGGGCVCCDLRGEFEDAVRELLTLVDVDRILVETTGLAEPDSLVMNVQEEIAGVRLEGVVTVLDADGLLQYKSWGQTLRSQIEAADLILLNKADLASRDDIKHLKSRIRTLRSETPVIETVRCQIDRELIFSMTHRETAEKPPRRHVHQLDVESFSYSPSGPVQQECFENLLKDIESEVYRIKGFIQFGAISYLFNWTRGRWDIEESKGRKQVLVFIARKGVLDRSWIFARLKNCEQE